ncbi:fimbrial protein [Luteibacter yeojuensis]
MTIRPLSGYRLATTVLIAAAVAVTCHGVRADDTLDFEVRGAITPSCGLALNRVQIDLGTVSASELAAVGDGSRWEGGRFVGVDCVGQPSASVTMRAKPHPADPRYIAPRGDELGVAIEIRTGDDQLLPPDGSVEFDWAGGVPELAFKARYVRVGPLKPGDAEARAQIDIQWH